jgi:hypothetical protein
MSANPPSLTLDQIQAAMPDGGLFGNGSWQWSPQPLMLSKSLVRELEGLGHVLAQFQRASDAIYRRSAKGKCPTWIAESLDRGKPDWLIESQRRSDAAAAFPRLIRPDLLLTNKGFSLTEIDSVPGGIGITGWLSQQYAAAGFSPLGGSRGMLDGFSSLLPADGAVLLRRRPEKGLLGGMMEVPSTPWGEKAQGEPPLRATWKALPGRVEHTFTHFHLELDVWRAVTIADGEMLEDGDYRWTPREDLAGEALPTVMRKVVAHVLKE